MDSTQLSAMTVKDLRECAKRLGIKRISTLKQKELIAAIEAAGKSAHAVIATVAAERESQKDASKTAKRTDKTTKDNGRRAKAPTQTDEIRGDADKTTKKAGTDNDGKKAFSPSKKAKRAVSSNEKTPALDAVDADIEDEDVIAKNVEDADEDEAQVKDVKEEPREPDSIFIDHGAILPEFIPGTCLYALIRDPGTLFVYWNTTFESPNGWVLTAYDASGNVLQSFTSPMRRSGRGYFRVPTARVSRVTLSNITEAGHSEVRLESRIRIAQQLGIAQSSPAYGERWVDFKRHQVVSEAPTQGRAPSYDAYVSKANESNVDWTGGGYNRSLDEQNVPFDATSSRFGRLSQTPSSDSHIGGFASSDKLVRR